MKKLVAMMMTIAVCAAMLAACGENSKDTADVKATTATTTAAQTTAETTTAPTTTAAQTTTTTAATAKATAAKATAKATQKATAKPAAKPAKTQAAKKNEKSMPKPTAKKNKAKATQKATQKATSKGQKTTLTQADIDELTQIGIDYIKNTLHCKVDKDLSTGYSVEDGFVAGRDTYDEVKKRMLGSLQAEWSHEACSGDHPEYMYPVFYRDGNDWMFHAGYCL